MLSSTSIKTACEWRAFGLKLIAADSVKYNRIVLTTMLMLNGTVEVIAYKYRCKIKCYIHVIHKMKKKKQLRRCRKIDGFVFKIVDL